MKPLQLSQNCAVELLCREKDNQTEQQYQNYSELYDLLNRQDKAAMFGEGMFRWIMNDGSGDIGIKHLKHRHQGGTR